MISGLLRFNQYLLLSRYICGYLNNRNEKQFLLTAQTVYKTIKIADQIMSHPLTINILTFSPLLFIWKYLQFQMAVFNK